MGALAWWLVPIGATILAAIWVTAAARWRRSRSRQAFGSIEDIERFRRALARPNVVTRPKDDPRTRR
jgi:hypothetical protein